MGKSALQTSFPTFTPVVQVGSTPGKFAGRVDLHAINRADNTDHPPFGKDFPTAHTRPLGHMLDTLDRFLFRHLRSQYRVLPIFSKFGAAAFVLLAADHCAEFFIELKFDTLLLALLALLLCIFVLAFRGGGLEDLRLHREEFIQ